ncbi:ARD/ARD' family-domain-containing protein [Gaertneriomyces semiglobifer]|nr:ARD/ARD' family-domain-containing protein [Gaertneriomyces semiglobifer]
MVKAWYLNGDPVGAAAQKPNAHTPALSVSNELLAELGFGISWVDVDGEDTVKHIVEDVCGKRGWRSWDEITISPKLPNYSSLLQTFYTEHFHPDAEIRLIIEGTGYFDVRSPNDIWIRVWAERGDLIVVVRSLDISCLWTDVRDRVMTSCCF